MLTGSLAGGHSLRRAYFPREKGRRRSWTTVVLHSLSHGALRGLLKRSFGGDAPITNAKAITMQARTVGIKRMVHKTALRTIDRPRPMGVPSEWRTTRSPVNLKLAVLPRRHSSTLQISQPTPSVATKRHRVSTNALMRTPKVAAGRPAYETLGRACRCLWRTIPERLIATRSPGRRNRRSLRCPASHHVP